MLIIWHLYICSSARTVAVSICLYKHIFIPERFDKPLSAYLQRALGIENSFESRAWLLQWGNIMYATLAF